jgi:hypothetical protein
MPRDDGIPHPSTVGDYYLSAILDEIRAIRAHLVPKEDAKTEPTPEAPAEAETMRVKEPEPAGPPGRYKPFKGSKR